MAAKNMMTEISITNFGGPEALCPRTVAIPQPARGEILVKVMAAGVNRPDVLQRAGKYPVPPGANPTPGLEIAGEVVALGEGVADQHVGQRVCGLTNGGGYAEYCTVPAGQALPWPDGYTAIQAAAIPETYFTVWSNLFLTGQVKAGETILVHGGTSGIGMTVVQLSKPFGYSVLATAGSSEKCAALEQLGAKAINYRESDFAQAAHTLTQGRGVNIVMDIIGAAYLDKNIDSLAMDGRLLLIGFLGGATAKAFDLAKIMSKRILITGSALRPRTTAQKAAIARSLFENVWPHLGQGRIEPIIHTTFPLAQAAQAHRLMESSQHIGKIVLTT